MVEGPSMAPALRHGDQVLVWWARRPRPGVGALVVVELPMQRGLGVKRLRAVDPDGALWIEGDNEHASTDSREFGALPADALRGRVLARIWPRPGRVHAAAAPDGPSIP
jgi:nickel-type superoxide dismutase maturation protease